MLGTIQQYAKKAKIETQPSVRNEVFAQRLMHTADYEFGLMAEIVVQTFAKVLLSDGFDAKLGIRHFADVYYDRSSAIDALNPFIAEDFARIDSRKIFEFDGADA
jgi:hypothetical protein